MGKGIVFEKVDFCLAKTSCSLCHEVAQKPQMIKSLGLFFSELSPPNYDRAKIVK